MREVGLAGPGRGGWVSGGYLADKRNRTNWRDLVRVVMCEMDVCGETLWAGVWCLLEVSWWRRLAGERLQRRTAQYLFDTRRLVQRAAGLGVDEMYSHVERRVPDGKGVRNTQPYRVACMVVLEVKVSVARMQ